MYDAEDHDDPTAEELARELAGFDDDDEVDLPDDEEEIGGDDGDEWSSGGENGRAVASPLWSRAKLHPECVGLHVYLEEAGSPRASLGILPVDATEATLIRTFPGAMPSPGEGYRRFVIMPVNGNDRTMGTERAVPISEHHQVLAQVRKAHQMAKRQGISVEEAEALIMGRHGGQALAAAQGGDTGGLLHVIELMRADRAAERERQAADQEELRAQRTQVVELIREQGRESSAAAAAVVERITETNQQARENDQAMAKQSTEMIREFAAGQIEQQRVLAAQQAEIQKQQSEGIQGFMSQQIQLLMAQQQGEVARIRADAEARERADKAAREEREARERREREDRERREREDREARDRRDREDRERRDRQEAERQERDRQWQAERERMWLESQKVDREARERADQAERDRRAAAEADRKEAAAARERERQRSHEAEMKRIESERAAQREHTQTLATLQMAQVNQKGGLKETIEGVTGVIAALGIDPANLIGGLAKRVLNPEAPAAPAPQEDSAALKLIGRVVDGVTDVARAGMIAKAQQANADKPEAPKQITADDLDDFDVDGWDDEDDDFDFEPAPVVATTPAVQQPAAVAAANSMSAPLPTGPAAPSAPAAPVETITPGEARLRDLVGVLQQAPEEAWETYITESLMGDPIAALTAVNEKGLKSIVHAGGGDDALFTKLKGKLEANAFIPDDIRWE